MKSLEDF